MKKCHYCGVENETVADVLYETDPLCDECFGVHLPLPGNYEEQVETFRLLREKLEAQHGQANTVS